MAKKTLNEIPTTILMDIMTLLANPKNLDKSSSVPLITFGMKIKEDIFAKSPCDVFPHRMTWVNGIFIDIYGELELTLSDNDSEYTADISLSAFPPHLTKKYVKLLKKQMPLGF